MATLTQVKNVLEKAKSGQFVVPFCNNTSADFTGYVVHIDKDIAKAVKIEDWWEEWPDEPAPSEDSQLIFKYKHGIAVNIGVEEGQTWTVYDDSVRYDVLSSDPDYGLKAIVND